MVLVSFLFQASQFLPGIYIMYFITVTITVLIVWIIGFLITSTCLGANPKEGLQKTLLRFTPDGGQEL